jgi:hypothetical protein
MPIAFFRRLLPEKEKPTLPTVLLTGRLDRRRHREAAGAQTATDIDWLVGQGWASRISYPRRPTNAKTAEFSVF